MERTEPEAEFSEVAPLAGLLRVSGLTFFSRVLGLVRDAAMAATFGNGAVLDAFSIAFRLPNLTRRLFGESAFSTAFLPVFVRELDQFGPAAGGKLASAILLMTGAIVSAITAVCMLALLIARSFSEAPDTRLLLGLTATLFPYQIFICLAAQAVAILHAFNRFTLPAVLPIVGNVIWLTVLAATVSLSDAPIERIYWIAAGIVVAGVLQSLVTIPALRRLDLPFRWDWAYAGPRVKEILGAVLPVLIGLSITEINSLADGVFAWLLTAPADAAVVNSARYPLPQGTAASLYLGQRLYQFPMGVFGVALGTILFPRFARHAVAERFDELREDLTLGLKLSLAIGVPASVGLVVMSLPLADVLFRYGEFDATDMRQTAAGIAGYGIGVWAFIALLIANRGFYALHDRRTPLRLGLMSAALNLLLSGAFVWFWGGFGLALGTSLAAMAQVILSLRSLGKRGLAPRAAESLAAFGKVVLASAGMAAVCITLRDVPAWSGGLAGRISQLFVPVAGGLLTYAVLSQLLGLRELRELLPRRKKMEPGRRIKIINLDDAGFAATTNKQMDADATSWAKVHLQGRSFTNTDTGWEIRVSARGIRHTLAKAREAEVFHSLKAIPELLKESQLVVSEPPKRPNTDVRAFHKFAAAIRTISGVRGVWVTIKETPDGRLFYDHRLTDVKTPAVDIDASDPEEPPTSFTAGDTISIGELFPGVNGGSDDPKQ